MDDLDFVAILEAAEIEPVSIAHQYRLQKDRDAKGVFAFFEGDEDKMIYLTHIKNRSKGRKVYSYICDGKKGVVKLFKELEDEDGSLLFFVDRDYDDWIGDGNNFGERVFVTKWYSAESYLGSSASIEALWDEFVPLPRDHRLEAFVKDFEKKKHEFARSLLPICAWVISKLKAGDKVMLSDLKLNQLIDFRGDCSTVRKKNAISELHRCHVQKNDALEVGNVVYWAKKIKELDPLLWIRGKYISWFISEYLPLRWGLIHKSVPKGKRKVVIPAGISQKKPFEAIGSRLECPEDLGEYLNFAIKNQ
ncbi:DUF4435 domain-containing protein [Azospirillum baldaniorum]|uniref:DUF4435 domain-containing protein n=1 Tax=Azospirillum baldaniorum TaxID=1064539 RepID=UPI00157AC72F|nr:DUF4435 domain-containing protein [Azospirillum baldaniorum]